ncbi:hypothetical protein V492_05261 [Pseudogymnoascus sp. VKM F-4246]|nr:hypothetical protein V492_05261 [Pseudogymnoascus sp. VKM F-4246]
MRRILQLLRNLKTIFTSSDPTAQLTKTSFTKYPPPPPKDIFDTYRAQYEEMLFERRYVDLHTDTDTPLMTLYRLYEYILLDQNIGMRNEIEYFWNQDKWAVCEIQDPEDDDPVRYAVLSCIPHLLVAAFNRNIKLGLPRDAPPIMTNDQIDEFRNREKKFETVPEWTKKATPLEETLRIPHIKGGGGEGKELEVLEDMNDERASIPFKEKNILIWEPHIFFI